MTSKNILFTLGFWVELPQILGLGFSVCDRAGRVGRGGARTSQSSHNRCNFPTADTKLMKKNATRIVNAILEAHSLGSRGVNDGHGKANMVMANLQSSPKSRQLSTHPFFQWILITLLMGSLHV